MVISVICNHEHVYLHFSVCTHTYKIKLKKKKMYAALAGRHSTIFFILTAGIKMHKIPNNPDLANNHAKEKLIKNHFLFLSTVC